MSADENLLAAWLDEALDDDGRARLAQRLSEDPQLRQRFAQLSATDHALRRIHGHAASPEEFLIGICARLPRTAPQRWWRQPQRLWSIGLAAAAVLVAAWLLMGTAPEQPRLLDAAIVTPAVDADGRLAPGSTITSGREPVRIALSSSASLLLWPYTRLQFGQRGDGPDWRLERGALTLETSGPGSTSLRIATRRTDIAVTGTILHVSSSDALCHLSVDRGSVLVRGEDGEVRPVTGGQSLTASATTPWQLVSQPGPPLRAVGDLLLEESAALAYHDRGPLLAELATGPVTTPLDAAWLRQSTSHDASLQVAIADDGSVICDPGSGDLRIALPSLSTAGLHLRLHVRLRPILGSTGYRFETSLFDGEPLPALTQHLPPSAALDLSDIAGRWVDGDLRALRIGRSATGLSVWEIRMAVGDRVLYGWTRGERPVLHWNLHDAGLDLRQIGLSEIHGP